MTAPGTHAAAGAFVPVARLADLPPGTLLGVTLPDGTPICLANVDGTVRAVHDVCTHQAFTLSSGELAAQGQIECAWHGARFDAATGTVCRGPACDPVATYEVRVVGEAIEVGGRVQDAMKDGRDVGE